MQNLIYLKKFWKNKKVFVTGHTGFKGSWLSIMLNLLEANVCGYSLKPNTKPNLFSCVKFHKRKYKSIIGDIRDYKKLKKSILNFSPDFIIHMAAQPLVSEAYKNPRYTYDVNIQGTVNILSILNELNFIKHALIVTTDKVYCNANKKILFKETDKLGGIDPYSSSKSCVELIVNSYLQSFLKKKKIYVVTARAGNVIGGGDFSRDRIIPDYFKSLLKNKKLFLRSPDSVRPWQHVLDPLYGYILILMYLYKKKLNKHSSFNFGPHHKNNKPVKEIVNLLNNDFNNKVKIVKKKNSIKFHESKILMLSSNKAKKILKWNSKYNLKQSLKLISDWHKEFNKRNNKKILDFTQNQIMKFLINISKK